MSRPLRTIGRPRLPVWLMGIANLSYGFYGGVVAFAVPQLLGARHVPEATIAGLTAIAYSPGFWAFLASPVLDVRFSRRGYAAALAIAQAVTLVAAFMNLADLPLLEIILTLGFCAAYLYQSALGGWLSSITTGDEEKTVSVSMTIANVGGFGLMAVGCNQLVSRLTTMQAALVLGASVLLPLIMFPFMQAPGPDRRLASESFPQFFRDLAALVKRRDVLVAVVLFIAPAGTFSLTNFLGSRGDDYHASPQFVGLIGGLGVSIAAVFGCLLFRPLSRRVALRPLYLAIGAIGGVCTLALTILPRTPASFAITVVAENMFQALAITTSIAITFEVIGRGNPLAATTFCFVASAYGVPISYMLYVDALGFAHGAIVGALLIDALAGVISSLLLGLMLFKLSRS